MDALQTRIGGGTVPLERGSWRCGERLGCAGAAELGALKADQLSPGRGDFAGKRSTPGVIS